MAFKKETVANAKAKASLSKTKKEFTEQITEYERQAAENFARKTNEANLKRAESCLAKINEILKKDNCRFQINYVQNSPTQPSVATLLVMPN